MAFKNPALYASGTGQQYVEVGNRETTGEPAILFHTGASSEVDPGLIRSSGETQDSPLELEIRGPVHQNAGGSYPSITMQTYATGERLINLDADRIAVNTPIIYETAWVDGWLLGTWVDAPGARIGVMKDAAGNVHLRGNVNGGATVAVGQLPSSLYYPSQSYEFVAKGGAGIGGQVAWQVTTTGAINILTNLALAQARMPLFATFPTL